MMKKILLLLIILISGVSIQAQDKERVSLREMKSNGAKAILEAKSAKDFSQVAAQYDEIAKLQKDYWAPIYYAAFARAVSLSKEKDKPKAEKKINTIEDLEKLKTLTQNEEISKDKKLNSELFALIAFINKVHIDAYPGKKEENIKEHVSNLSKADKLNNNNPRVLLQLATNILNEKAAGKEYKSKKAMDLAEQVIDLIEKESDNKDRSQDMPNWGATEAQAILKKLEPQKDK